MTKPPQVTRSPTAPCWAAGTFSVCSYGFFDSYAILVFHSGGNRAMLRYIELIFHAGTSLPTGFIKDQHRVTFRLIRVCQHAWELRQLQQLSERYSNLLLQGPARRGRLGNRALAFPKRGDSLKAASQARQGTRLAHASPGPGERQSISPPSYR